MLFVIETLLCTKNQKEVIKKNLLIFKAMLKSVLDSIGILYVIEF